MIHGWKPNRRPNTNTVNTGYPVFAGATNIDLIKLKGMRTKLTNYCISDQAYDSVINGAKLTFGKKIDTAINSRILDLPELCDVVKVASNAKILGRIATINSNAYLDVEYRLKKIMSHGT